MAYNNYGNSFQRTTPVVLNLVIINVLCFFAQYLFHGVGEGPVVDRFALHYYKAAEFQLYQLITYMFMHGGWTHLFFNMFGLWMFGSIVERVWGPKRFLIFYFACGIAAGIFQIAAWGIELRGAEAAIQNHELYLSGLKHITAVGASGAIMGILAAFGYLFPNTPLMIIPIPVPVKAKWLVLGIILIDLFSGIANSAGDDIGHWAHVGGAVTGFLIVFIQNKMSRKTFY